MFRFRPTWVRSQCHKVPVARRAESTPAGTVRGLGLIMAMHSMSAPSEALSKQNRSDCPLCQKFGKGPCGGPFYQWLECTEAAIVGEDDSDVTTRCAPLFEEFQSCLERHESQYFKDDANDVGNSNPDIRRLLASMAQSTGTGGVDYGQQSTEILEAWQHLIDHELSPEEYPRHGFPPQLVPKVIRMGGSSRNNNDKNFRTGMAFVSVDPNYLVLVYVTNQEHKLIAAAGKNDLFCLDSETVTLLLPSTKTIKSIVVTAVYEFPKDQGGLVKISSGEEDEEDEEVNLVVYEHHHSF